MKAEHSWLIPQKFAANLELFTIVKHNFEYCFLKKILPSHNVNITENIMTISSGIGVGYR